MNRHFIDKLDNVWFLLTHPWVLWQTYELSPWEVQHPDDSEREETTGKATDRAQGGGDYWITYWR